MRVAILNYADVRNFGDVLFPMVLAREICVRLPDVQIEYVTPTGGAWAGMQSKRFDRIDLNTFDALILGGGEVVHRYDEMLRTIYSQFELESIDRPTDLVFGWKSCAVPFKAWVAVGVPETSIEVRADIQSTAQSLQYLGARGSRSAARLAANSAPNQVIQTPDLGWLFPRLLETRKTLNPVCGQPYIAVQSLGFDNVTAAAAAIRRISESTGLRIVLLPLTRCWQDIVPLRALQKESRGKFILVDDGINDLDKLAVLGSATIYVGQSMHGLIGALSQCRPAGICLPDADDKFGELLRDSDIQKFRSVDWSGVETLVETLLAAPLGMIAQRRAAAVRQLDQLFDDLCSRMIAAVSTQSQPS
jgi:polysaccharide pyruvyl transferase WcaK-like protein